MATIFIRANTVRPSVDRRSDDTAFGVGTFSWQDPVHSWKAGPCEVMTVENKQKSLHCKWLPPVKNKTFHCMSQFPMCFHCTFGIQLMPQVQEVYYPLYVYNFQCKK